MGPLMAGGSLLALLDDITTILDDVATLTKVATKKTAGVLGDDLALNAQQVSGVDATRELPVVWAVAKGSLLNKVILVPAALLISAVAPWAVTPLLMVGGLYLCFEGFEKIAHRFLHGDDDEEAAHHASLTRALVDPEVDLVALERDKIKGAIRTDFILSAEIVVISLGTVATQPFMTRVAVLAGIALLMTVGVYGLVAGIVKLDDAGLWLSRREGAGAGWQRAFGRGLLRSAPWLMKALSVLGTAAMFLVGGSIISHGLPALHHLAEGVAAAVAQWPVVGAVLKPVSTLLIDGLVGVLAGALAVAGVEGFSRVRGRLQRA
jgi:predicted DNA repair protein MutK